MAAWWRAQEFATIYDWERECPELVLPPEGHVRLVRTDWAVETRPGHTGTYVATYGPLEGSGE